MAFFSATELEYKVTKLYRLQKNWTSDTPTPTSIREFEPVVTNDQGPAFSIFPGGRWLIAVEGMPLRVVSYDLDSPGYPANVLIDSSPEHAGREPAFSDSPVRRVNEMGGFGLVLESIPSERRKSECSFLGRVFHSSPDPIDDIFELGEPARFSFWNVATEGSTQSELKLTASYSWTVDPPPSQFFWMSHTDGEVLAQVSDDGVDLLRQRDGAFREATSLVLESNVSKPPICPDDCAVIRLTGLCLCSHTAISST